MKKTLIKKIGEVIALSHIAANAADSGKRGLSEVFKKKDIEMYRKTTEGHMRKLLAEAKRESISDEVETPHEKSMKKFNEMQLIYLNNKWDEGEEVLEWLGFIEGAAVVHFSLVQDLAKEEKVTGIKTIAGDALKFHKAMLKIVTESIKKAA